jgi:hypothetical protein
MDDVVAVEVELDDGALRYFITWGRIQDAVDGRPVADLVLRHSRKFSLGAEPVRARLCGTLRVAALSDDAPYFYECLRQFSAVIPFGETYEAWRTERAAAMEAGQEIAYCGKPGPGLD